ncbi:glycine zipper family protein [Fibrobacter sp. UWB11]|uniref:glycine zipper family protein n=1 Tax=Fibrobacter sp. UWB11 TaxID=1896202 RepID=UPI00092A088F|nr:glycine zipper family protein [Fibrobacter sp. UWB11]SIN85321.1 hypothetical protein SAMN05720758_0244 [Fibrobacter sp. UWB11]
MRLFRSKNVLLLLLSVLLLVSTANAGKKGLGTLIGAGVGAVTGAVAEKKIKEAMEKDTYAGEGFVLTEQGILLKYKEGDVFLNIKKMTDLDILKEVIKTTNRVDVTKKAEWGNLKGRVPVCADDTSCATIIVDITKEKILSVQLAFSDDPSDTFDLIAYQATEPGFGTYAWNFIINNPILIGVILFGLIGFIWDHRPSKKKKAAEQNEAVAETSAEVENKDNNEQV